MNAEKSINLVTEQKLCCACGSCVGTCPVQAISLCDSPAGFVEAVVDNDKCVVCGRCLQVCPSYEKNSKEIFEQWPKNWHEGDALVGYIGHATDEQQRFSGQSGGVVTGLLAWLLQSGQIDVAAVNHFSIEKQRPEAMLARTVEEIKKSAGSYYLQTAVLSKLDKDSNIERCAVVCTGCQSEALHLAEKNLGRKKPYVTIGLVCEGVYSMGMFNELSVPKSEFGKIKEFRFRDKRNGGWPGGVYMDYIGHKPRKLPIRSRMQLKPCYASYHCQQCVDMNNLYADIVCGDPWFMQDKLSNDSLYRGETVVVARTEKGVKLLEEAAEAGVLCIEKINYKDFFEYNSFTEGRVAKNCNVQSVCRKHKLPELYPQVNLADTIHDVKFQNKSVEKQLLYTWAYCHATDPDKAAEMVRRRKRQDFIKNLLRWPIALIGYLVRRLKAVQSHLFLDMYR